MHARLPRLGFVEVCGRQHRVRRGPRDEDSSVTSGDQTTRTSTAGSPTQAEPQSTMQDLAIAQFSFCTHSQRGVLSS